MEPVTIRGTKCWYQAVFMELDSGQKSTSDCLGGYGANQWSWRKCIAGDHMVKSSIGQVEFRIEVGRVQTMQLAERFCCNITK